MVKQFTIPCQFGQETSPVTLYIGHPEDSHHPLHHQNEWLRSAKGGSIPQDLMDTLQKLHDLAKKNGADFEDLCYYALISATQHSANGISINDIHKYADEFVKEQNGNDTDNTVNENGNENGNENNTESNKDNSNAGNYESCTNNTVNDVNDINDDNLNNNDIEHEMQDNNMQSQEIRQEVKESSNSQSDDDLLLLEDQYLDYNCVNEERSENSLHSDDYNIEEQNLNKNVISNEDITNIVKDAQQDYDIINAYTDEDEDSLLDSD